MTLEEISVRFTADIAPLSAAVSEATGLLTDLGARADALESAFRLSGAQAAEGLRQGLISRRFSVMDAARSLADAAAEALRAALDIHSPSRLTYQVGAYFDEGLLRGISGSAGRVEREAAALGHSAAAALAVPDAPDSPLPNFSPLSPLSAPAADAAALPPISLTVPLEIDGYRLGVAAIDAINRVTQSTGRVELEI